MSYSYNEKNVQIAQILRKRMTDEEKKLWYHFLKALPVNVHRQKNIGEYIVDFYIAEKQIVIELDGSQHYTPVNRKKDSIRDEYLRSLGITVLRYSNNTVNNSFYTVCHSILKHLDMDTEETMIVIQNNLMREHKKEQLPPEN